jgi:hypothetical protein
LALGICAFGRDPSAALVDYTSIVAAIEGKKLGRSTGIGGIPGVAISRCLEPGHAKITESSPPTRTKTLAVFIAPGSTPLAIGDFFIVK